MKRWSPPKAIFIPQISITISGKRVKQASSLQYLGPLIVEDDRCEKKILRRIRIAQKIVYVIVELLTSHDVSLATKLRLTKCYVW